MSNSLLVFSNFIQSNPHIPSPKSPTSLENASFNVLRFVLQSGKLFCFSTSMGALIHIGQNQMVSSYHNLLLNYRLWLFTVDLLKENVMHKKKNMDKVQLQNQLQLKQQSHSIFFYWRRILTNQQLDYIFFLYSSCL